MFKPQVLSAAKELPTHCVQQKGTASVSNHGHGPTLSASITYAYQVSPCYAIPCKS